MMRFVQSGPSYARFVQSGPSYARFVQSGLPYGTHVNAHELRLFMDGFSSGRKSVYFIRRSHGQIFAHFVCTKIRNFCADLFFAHHEMRKFLRIPNSPSFAFQPSRRTDVFKELQLLITFDVR